MASKPDELVKILEDLGEGFIDVSEAARRAHIAETEPGRYNCGTCQWLKGGECRAPGQPARAESPLSVRCQRYEWRDPHADAMPASAVVARKTNSRMFK
jgi:predicted dienelactone hydrolase